MYCLTNQRMPQSKATLDLLARDHAETTGKAMDHGTAALIAAELAPIGLDKSPAGYTRAGDSQPRDTIL